MKKISEQNKKLTAFFYENDGNDQKFVCDEAFNWYYVV